ncbi:hypothetical protein [Paenibacillus sp. YIM B09110]
MLLYTHRARHHFRRKEGYSKIIGRNLPYSDAELSVVCKFAEYVPAYP